MEKKLFDAETLGQAAQRMAVPHRQGEVAQAIGVSQPQIGRAYAGKASHVAAKIIEHFGGKVEGPFYFVIEEAR